MANDVPSGLLLVDAEFVKIPDGDYDDPAFKEFCDYHDIFPLGSSRRGWWPEIQTYLRGADYVMFLDGRPIELYSKDDLIEVTDKDGKKYFTLKRR